MNRIKLLENNISNMIAAGEVVERPLSVVKELVENSIDAKASKITIEIKNGGVSYIRVKDNGSGIEYDDAIIAFERHATSKILKKEDLFRISSLGFRGEALASISSVSFVELFTQSIDSRGRHIIMQGGKIIRDDEKSLPQGTTIIVRKLFYNTPARLKFLKSNSTEAAYIKDYISKIAIAHPQISFILIINGTENLFTYGNGKEINAITSLYGNDCE